MTKTNSTPTDNYYDAYIIEDEPSQSQANHSHEQDSSSKHPSLLASALQIVMGAILVLIGIPLLILPGPGLLTIAGGIALVVTAIRRITSPFARSAS